MGGSSGGAAVAPLAPTTGWGLVRKALATSWWIWLLPAALVVALVLPNFQLLDYVHVLSAILWTGGDLLMGFVVGPVMRRLSLEHRMRVQTELLPRTLLFFPVMAASTTTAGWYLAEKIGAMRPESPLYWWFVAALAVVAFLTVQGLGVLLPTNVRVYFEMQRPRPDGERVRRLMGRYYYLTGFQGLLQVAIVFVMAHLALG